MNDLPFPTVGIAGIGLIGGSLAKDLRAFGLAGRILGWNRTAAHAERAVELGLVDAALPTLGELAAQSDLLVLAMPVDVLAERLPALLDAARPDQTLIDVGSTKRALAEAGAGPPTRPRYAARPPLARTHRSRPDPPPATPDPRAPAAPPPDPLPDAAGDFAVDDISDADMPF